MVICSCKGKCFTDALGRFYKECVQPDFLELKTFVSSPSKQAEDRQYYQKEVASSTSAKPLAYQSNSQPAFSCEAASSYHRHPHLHHSQHGNNRSAQNHSDHQDHPVAAHSQPQHHREPRWCNICSFTQTSPTPKSRVYHRHFSSLRQRELAGVEAPSSYYLCPSCKSCHLPYPEPRIKVIVSDSTLHQFFAPPDYLASKQYEGDVMHVDYITIPGASIDTLSRAFRLDYIDKNHPKPLDVVLVAGYNDIIKGQTKQNIMNSFLKFTDLVKSAGSSLYQESNTVVVSDLMYAPQLSWFPDDGKIHSNHRGNQVEKLNWLNQALLDLNKHNGITEFHRLHEYGMHCYTRKYIDQNGQEHHRKIKSHRFELWRESDCTKMLHLTNDQRFKLGAALNKYFVQRT